MDLVPRLKSADPTTVAEWCEAHIADINDRLLLSLYDTHLVNMLLIERDVWQKVAGSIRRCLDDGRSG